MKISSCIALLQNQTTSKIAEHADKIISTNTISKYDEYLGNIMDWAVVFIPKLILAGLVLVIGFRVVAKLEKIISKAISKSNIDPEISSFLISIIEIILKIVVVLIAVSIIGVELSALVGLLAAAGFAVGMALQGFLGNFASGLTIVFFKPYKVGDWVKVADAFGQVQSIQIFNTILKTPNDKTLVIPNGKVTDDIVTNFSTTGKMRLELSVLMAYEESYPKIEAIIREALRKVDILIQDPAPHIGIESYDTHNIILTVRPYIHPDDYWSATFQANQAIKKALSEHGVKMAYSEGVELGPIGE